MTNDNTKNVFIAPVAGCYLINAELYIAKPTGKFRTIENPCRSFWQIWKPKYIEQEIYERVVNSSGFEIKFLNRNENIEVDYASLVKKDEKEIENGWRKSVSI